MKIAYFSPLPPNRSGIADYSAGLLPSLAQRAAVDLWIDCEDSLKDLRLPRFNYVRNPVLLSRLETYDAVLYHLGNSAAHINIYRTFLLYPGIVMLHDYVLHHFFAEYLLDHLRSPELYVEEMEFNYGTEGRTAAQRFLHDRTLPLWETAPFQFPLNKRIFEYAEAIIVHSRFARDLVAATAPGIRVETINHFARILPQSASVPELRRKYGLPEDKIIIGAFGFGVPAKRLGITINAIRRLSRKDVLFLVVGEMPQGVAIDRSEALVLSTGYVSSEALEDYLKLIDICVSLRWPTMGETSGSVCRVLGAGKPCIVSDVGWFAELPDACVAKVGVDGHEEAGLAAHLKSLIEDPGLRKRMGEDGRRHIAQHHCAGAIAQQFVDFMARIATERAQERLQRQILARIGSAFAGLGVRDRDVKLLEPTARQLASILCRGRIPRDSKTASSHNPRVTK